MAYLKSKQITSRGTLFSCRYGVIRFRAAASPLTFFNISQLVRELAGPILPQSVAEFAGQRQVGLETEKQVFVSSEKCNIISDENMKKHADSIDAAILDRIQSGAPGDVFAPTDFLDLGGRAAVDQALSRNCRAGLIRKASRGLYDVPHNHPLIGPLSPSSDAVIKAITRRDGIVLQAAGGRCANDLGISDQVPAKAVYLTNGRSRRIQVGKSQITLKHASSRTMATAGTVSGHVIQALRWIGRRYVDDRIIAQLRRNLEANHKAQLMKDLCHAPAWVADIMRQIAAPT